LSIKKILTTLVLTVVLFGLPIGSWFYLRDGVRYRKERLAQLSDYNRWGATENWEFRKDSLFAVPLHHYVRECSPWAVNLTNGAQLSPDSIKGCISVVHVFDPKSEISQKVAPQIQRIQKAFGEERTDIKIISIPAAGVDSLSIQAFAKQFPARIDTWYMAFSDNNNMGAKLKVAANKPAANPLQYGALIDQHNTIRQYYDLTSTVEVNRMIEVISIIMRPKPSPKIRFRRRGEK
jgi:hypothetical protein